MPWVTFYGHDYNHFYKEEELYKIRNKYRTPPKKYIFLGCQCQCPKSGKRSSTPTMMGPTRPQKKGKKGLNVVASACNPSTREAEAGGSVRVREQPGLQKSAQGQHELHSEILSQKDKNK